MKKFFPLMLLAWAGFACADHDLLPIPNEPEQIPTKALTRSAATFEVLPNPYTLANMQAVYSNAGSSRTLQPTHLYVRFLPQDSLQMNRLKYDLNLELFDYPLDRQIEDGEVYIDPSIPEGALTWQYTTVPVGFSPPSGITYQVLEQCYIPEEDEAIAPTRGGSVDVEAAAFERLGYTVEPDAVTRGLFGTSIYPEGTIRVYNDASNEYVPVRGVKIRCHTIVKWSTAYTDENGYYRMQSKFSIGPHYAIVFDNRKGFDIWGNWAFYARANYNMGWHSKSGHSRDIWAGSQAWPWAVVNNAGYDYYEMCEETGISKPPSNLKIWVSDMWQSGAAPMVRRVWHPIGANGNAPWATFLSNIVVGSQATFWNTVLKPVEPDIVLNIGSTYRRAYELTSHELAHASHFRNVGSAYWAKYISYIITYGAYGDETKNNAELCAIGEMWGYAMENIQGYEEFIPDRLNSNERYPGTDRRFFKPHVFWDLITDGHLTKKQVYDCLTSDVDTYAKLIAKMYQKYPTRADSIEAAFVRHGIDRNVAKPPTVVVPPPPSFYIVNSNNKNIAGRDAMPFYPNDSEWSYEFGYNLEVLPYRPQYTYIWDAEVFGNCHDWKFFSNQNSYYESIEACILSGSSGVSFWISCKIYDGNNLIAEPVFVLDAYPAPGYFRKLSPDSLTNVRQPGMPVPIR